ncbi:hypothetical protein TBLA_0B08080 [Henningerozyma blattae CBS 6284]|uniref:Aminotransferase class I/classII large domain-containing protein n=1 Tax=Henningerozyma blattae (strain ATCC 34711 / CBS 6284 / DSM 70876 / NBRC 10599 / NRRL Y-10934 / UCD 77-7) TaxID=1071380 RepID=I2GZS2_HENB6|nr:hypothetical protein TBLA_0B08080 [Tetrapisispora blattae CBS 6284]CCH59624.1 hypothetical protein TBLA_0B08080 [Tetrapisispora blattae CBS 6284]
MNEASKINLFKGHPSYRLLPRKEISIATCQLLSEEARPYDDDTTNRHPLTYGSDEGALWVRQEVCNMINQIGSDINSKPEYINLTSGASYGILNILLQTTLPHTGYTKQAFIVSPTYFLINDCFIDAGFGSKMTAIKEKGYTSIDLEYLKEKLEYFEQEIPDVPQNSTDIIQNKNNLQKKIYKYVFYCIPTFSNPSGITWDYETRIQLIKIAKKYDMLIICDDVYDLLDYNFDSNATSNVAPRLVHLDRMLSNEQIYESNFYGNTISNASFSKLVAPGLRIGYHETANKMLVGQVSKGGANISGGTPSQLNSMIIGTLLKNKEIYKIISNFRTVYKIRGDALYNSSQKFLPKNTKFQHIEGGYFAWVVLPEGYNAQVIGQMLKNKYSVIVANGSTCEVVGDLKGWGERCIRLSISFLEKEAIEQGIQYLGMICKEYAVERNLEF